MEDELLRFINIVEKARFPIDGQPSTLTEIRPWKIDDHRSTGDPEKIGADFSIEAALCLKDSAVVRSAERLRKEDFRANVERAGFGSENGPVPARKV